MAPRRRTPLWGDYLLDNSRGPLDQTETKSYRGGATSHLFPEIIQCRHLLKYHDQRRLQWCARPFSADLTDAANLPELHIESDIDFFEDEVWIEANEVPNPCINYPSHWTLETHTHMNLLLKFLVKYLMEQFKDDPSYTRFKVIHELDPDYQESMLQCLRCDMIHSRNAANCALRVFLAYHLFGDVEKVITNAGHLFQPRDYLILQAAAKGLGRRRGSLAFALGLFESQLIDVLECIQAAIVEIWNVGDKAKKAKKLLDEILTLPSNDPIRAAKVSEWKENAFTVAPVGPSEVFDAMFGFGREDDEEDDPLLSGGSGTCPNAGEYSPSGSAGEVDRKLLRKRWCTWMKVGSRLPRGNPSLANVYNRVEKRMREMFPWIRLGDVRNHVIIRWVSPNHHSLRAHLSS